MIVSENEACVSTKDLARLLGHNHKTIRRWLMKGIISAEEGKTKPRGKVGRPKRSKSLKFNVEQVKAQLKRHMEKSWEV